MAVGALSVGSVFAGDFRIVKPLSAGGMGTVYVAHQISTGRDRALKIMLGDLAGHADLTRRFVQEARIGAEIDSEHVVEVVGAGIDNETQTPWLAMELLQGMDLAEHLRRSGPLPAPMVLDIFEQLAHALGAAHDKQIVHRDLKPENLFLANTRRAGGSFTLKVLDFGIAKLVNQVRTSATGAMGTPLWMAPEQAQSGARVTMATDVWAMGLIAFRALAGACFWKSAGDANASAIMVLREVVMDPIPWASARAAELGGPALPPGFDAWFARCVERDPARRFQHARQAQDELRRILAPAAAAGAAAAAAPPAPPPQVQPIAKALPSAPATPTGPASVLPSPPMAAPAGQPKRRSLGLFIGLGACVLAAVLTLGAIKLLGKKQEKAKRHLDASGNPALVVDAEGVSFGGDWLASAPDDKLQRIEPLIKVLKQGRDELRAKNPSGSPPNGLTIELPADTTCSAALSVLQSAALGGRTELSLRLGSNTHELSIYLTGTEDYLAGGLGAELAPQLTFSKNGSIAVAKRPCSADYDKVPVERLGATVSELAGGSKMKRMVVACEPGVAMSAVLAAHEVMSSLPERSGARLQLSAMACHRGREWLALVDADALLRGAGGDPDAPTAPWGRDDSLGQDRANREDQDDEIIQPPGSGRLSSSARAAKPPTARVGEIQVRAPANGLTVDDVNKALEGAMSRISSCYFRALNSNPNLAGRVRVEVEVGKLGSILSASSSGDLPDAAAIGCVTRVIAKRVSFSPAPSKLTRVTIPIVFSPW